MQTASTEPGQFGWNRIMTNDIEAAKDFYKKMFNWTTHEEVDVYGTTYTIFKSGNKLVAGLRGIPPEAEGQIKPHWMSFVNVVDINLACKKAEQLGAEITFPIAPVKDLGYLTVIKDPSGVYFGLVQHASSV